MALLHHPSERFRFRRRRGFTLVELITAAALMTLMMMGVVQIFAIITETASQAQGSAYAMEQGRALLDSIHRDIRGFDRMGYFRIQASDTNDAGAPLSLQTPPTVPNQRPVLGAPVFALTPITWYSTDCLALTSVGFWEGQTGNARRYTGAEVVYSANVKTPDNRFEVKAGSQSLTVDPRRGLIGRGVWLLTGTDQTTGGSDSDDRSKAAVMADLAGTTVKKRLDLTDSKDNLSTLAVPRLSVKPMTSFGVSLSPWQFRRVAASCASEFLVDALNIPVAAAPNWPLPRAPCGANPIKDGDPTTNAECPRAIRVTVAIHDPSDKKPSTGSSRRYEGYTLQEVFWISDP